MTVTAVRPSNTVDAARNQRLIGIANSTPDLATAGWLVQQLDGVLDHLLGGDDYVPAQGQFIMDVTASTVVVTCRVELRRMLDAAIRFKRQQLPAGTVLESGYDVIGDLLYYTVTRTVTAHMQHTPADAA